MKKTLFIAALLLGLAATANAQTNIQEMYDFQRGHFTTTIEGFYADDWGSTFFFTDIYHPTDQLFPTDYYTEIARALNFWKNSKFADFSLHVEWNGGVGFGYGVSNCWLFGVEYFMHSADFRNTFTFELMYKRINALVANDISYVPVQFTFVWGMKDLLNVEGLSFSGFLDIWGEKNYWGSEETGLVLLTEPQIWYNVGRHFGCPNLNVGGEVEIAYNFTGASPANYLDRKGLTVAPCLGIKWVF